MLKNDSASWIYMELRRSRNVCPFLYGSEEAWGLSFLQLMAAGPACIWRDHWGWQCVSPRTSMMANILHARPKARQRSDNLHCHQWSWQCDLLRMFLECEKQGLTKDTRSFKDQVSLQQLGLQLEFLCFQESHRVWETTAEPMYSIFITGDYSKKSRTKAISVPELSDAAAKF